MRSMLIGHTVYRVRAGTVTKGVVVQHDATWGFVDIEFSENNTVMRQRCGERHIFKRVVFSFVGPVGLDPP